MTYIVFGGTLNLAQSINQPLSQLPVSETGCQPNTVSWEQRQNSHGIGNEFCTFVDIGLSVTRLDDVVSCRSGCRTMQERWPSPTVTVIPQRQKFNSYVLCEKFGFDEAFYIIDLPKTVVVVATKQYGAILCVSSVPMQVVKPVASKTRKNEKFTIWYTDGRGCRRRLKIWNLFVCRSRDTLFPRQSTARKRRKRGSVVGGLGSWPDRRVYACMFRGSIARGGRATNQARMIDGQKRTVRCIRRRIWNKRCVNTCCRPLNSSSLKRRVMIPYNKQVFDVQSKTDRAGQLCHDINS